MDEKRLDPEVERKIKEEIDKWPALSNFHYIISEDGKEISVSMNISVPNSENADIAIKRGEKILNATFEKITIINDVYTFILKFNQ